MTAIPPGIRPESARIPSERVPDSALNAEQGSEGQGISTSARDHGTSAQPGKWTRDQRELSPLDALAAAVCLIRPEWNHTTVRSTLLRTHGSWREIATRALRVALDDDARTPYAIENGDMRRYERSDAERHPSAVTYTERMAELRRINDEESA